MFKSVLFDLDGTLINTNNLIIKSFKYTLKKHLNIMEDEKEIVKYFGEPLITTLKRYDEKNAEALVDTYRRYNSEMHDKLTQEIDGVQEAIHSMKEMGIIVGVVTSKKRITAERGLKLFNLFDYMDIIVTPEDTNKHKPDGEPILKACEMLNINPNEVLYVGDSHYDILCGKNAGTKTCIVKYTALDLKELYTYNPDYAVDSLTEIVDIINNK